MAVDKLVDSTELDNGLTTIADAIRTKGGTSALLTFPDGMAQAVADIPTGITPTGNINITDTNPTNVTNYATATIVDADLVASNIKKDVNILGVVGTFEGGGGGSLPSSISKLDGGSFTFAVDSKGDEISHNLGAVPKGFVVWTEDAALRNATAETDSYLLSAYVDCLNFTGGTGGVTAYAAQPTLFYKRANGNISVTGNSDATLSKWASTNYFKISTSSVSYKASATYKWLAWA